MRVTFLNNEGAGFADAIEVEPGTTAQKLFTDKLPGRSPQDYLIRVNRLPVTADQVLVDGDRVSITPRKIEGALLRIVSRAA